MNNFKFKILKINEIFDEIKDYFIEYDVEIVIEGFLQNNFLKLFHEKILNSLKIEFLERNDLFLKKILILKEKDQHFFGFFIFFF
jgi:DNA-directed RNA polymerase